MSWLVKVGAFELAFGALSGWVITLNLEYPQVLARAGVSSSRRLLQAHLDYIIMGVILIALGLAAPRMPDAIAGVLAGGAIVNPTLFLPLAFNERERHTLRYRAVAVLSFIAMSGGATAVAVYLVS